MGILYTMNTYTPSEIVELAENAVKDKDANSINLLAHALRCNRLCTKVACIVPENTSDALVEARLLNVLCKFSKSSAVAQVKDTFVSTTTRCKISPEKLASVPTRERPYVFKQLVSEYTGDATEDVVRGIIDLNIHDVIRTSCSLPTTTTESKEKAQACLCAIAACIGGMCPSEFPLLLVNTALIRDDTTPVLYIASRPLPENKKSGVGYAYLDTIMFMTTPMQATVCWLESILEAPKFCPSLFDFAQFIVHGDAQSASKFNMFCS